MVEGDLQWAVTLAPAAWLHAASAGASVSLVL